MKHIKTLKIDIDKKNFEVIPSVQYDSNTRFLHIQLLNNSVPCDITGCSVILSGVKEDGTSIFNSCDVINPEIAFIQAEITEQMNVIPGLIDCEIKIYDGEGVLTSKKFTIKVTASQTSRSVVSSNEFKALTDALNKVQAIDSKAEKAEVEKLTSQLDTKANKKEVESLIKNKANSSDLEVERNRINNLVANAGNTDENSELLDLRIDNTGTNYGVSGESIRFSQDGKLLDYDSTALSLGYRKFLKLPFEYGSINGANGNNATDTVSIRIIPCIDGSGMFIQPTVIMKVVEGGKQTPTY